MRKIIYVVPITVAGKAVVLPEKFIGKVRTWQKDRLAIYDVTEEGAKELDKLFKIEEA